MSITLIGSRAMKVYFNDARDPKDWDYLCDTELEAEILRQTFYHDPKLLDIKVHSNFGYCDFDRIASPDEQYTIKMSHMYWLPNRSEKKWDQHMNDCIFLARKGAKLIERTYELLVPVWKEQYTKKEPNLTKNKEQFFSDAVVRKYDHDSLHESVAYNSAPLYTWVLKSGSEVDCDWDKFENLIPTNQLNMMREEIYVTALERYIIPSDYTYHPRVAYQNALRKCATSLFKGKWARFIHENLDNLRRPDVDYVQRHKDNSHRLILLEEK